MFIKGVTDGRAFFASSGSSSGAWLPAWLVRLFVAWFFRSVCSHVFIAELRGTGGDGDGSA